MNQKALPVWRSLLFVPVTQRRFVDGAARRGADAIILDLEDSVAASEKERARTLVPEAAEIVSRGGADVMVRLNRPLRMTVRDLEAVIGPGVQAVALPKAESADHVRLVAEIIDELEASRGMPVGATKMLAMVETADAFFRIHEIAKASPRLVALNLGAEDFALSAGMLPEAEGLFMPKQVCVFAARAAGIMPLGFVGTVAEFHDLDGFRETVRRSRRIGFVGASVIHPSQVAILNEDSGRCRGRPGRVVAAYDKNARRGVRAVTADGKMIDVPSWSAPSCCSNAKRQSRARAKSGRPARRPRNRSRLIGSLADYSAASLAGISS
jgi:citrate lyase subunit beta/citryl-CoA lyase